MSTMTFKQLNLNTSLLSSLERLGYETPTPIQAESIPVLLEGRDLQAQAQTGTGKTAAFALPILSTIDLSLKQPQALIIAPTRELAIQVAEAFQNYAKDLKGFHVLPIYGGQDYSIQLKALKRGAQVIVGTPGRLMDHIERGKLNTDHIQTLILDEADEMLKMGFIDDIEWILERITHEHQTGLFSATLPAPIKKIAKRYLNDAVKIEIKPTQNSIEQIDQCYIRVAKSQKLEALTRFLEVEEMDAAIIFSRTKTYCAELAERLQARGYAAAPLHGDMAQAARKKVIERIKGGSLDIVIATDVAARGIDVDRITHVINYDIPYDNESYIHRIGRTGRAGRSGKAILFVTDRERRLLNDLKHAVKAPLREIEPPSIQEMNAIRAVQLTEKVVNIITKSKKLNRYRDLIETIIEQSDADSETIAAALAYLIDQANPLPTEELAKSDPKPKFKRAKKSFSGKKKFKSRA